jgi:hypothetical protein
MSTLINLVRFVQWKCKLPWQTYDIIKTYHRCIIGVKWLNSTTPAYSRVWLHCTLWPLLPPSHQLIKCPGNRMNMFCMHVLSWTKLHYESTGSFINTYVIRVIWRHQDQKLFRCGCNAYLIRNWIRHAWQFLSDNKDCLQKKTLPFRKTWIYIDSDKALAYETLRVWPQVSFIQCCKAKSMHVYCYTMGRPKMCESKIMGRIYLISRLPCC